MRAPGKYLKKDTFVLPLNMFRVPPRSVPSIALSPGDTEKSEPTPRSSEPWREADMTVGPRYTSTQAAWDQLERRTLMLASPGDACLKQMCRASSGKGQRG